MAVLESRTMAPVGAEQGNVRWKALIFDVDGTLYEQGPVRRAVFCRILRAHWASPLRGIQTLRALHAYRQAQESLRDAPPDVSDIARTQILLAGERVGGAADVISPWVSRWMEQEPLPYLMASMRDGVIELLQKAKTHGMRLAVFSDYPADRKLKAMGIADYFDVVVTAQDPEVQRLKPDPKGLELTLRRLGVQKHEAVYVGDRAEIDGVAASCAGIQHFILNGSQGFRELSQWLILQG